MILSKFYGNHGRSEEVECRFDRGAKGRLVVEFPWFGNSTRIKETVRLEFNEEEFRRLANTIALPSLSKLGAVK